VSEGHPRVDGHRPAPVALQYRSTSFTFIFAEYEGRGDGVGVVVELSPQILVRAGYFLSTFQGQPNPTLNGEAYG